MVEILREVIENNEIIDIYLRNRLNNKCELVYARFRVTELDLDNSLFVGYAYDDRQRSEGNRILTEDNISLICRIVRP